ncbi:hypothetical protein PC111_g24637, partial [Phytophthora cactorum]
MRMLPRPGRAGGMLHDDIALGAASARAQAAPAPPPAPYCAFAATAASPARPAAPESAEVQRSVLAPPGRAGGMLPDSAAGATATAAARAPAAPAGPHDLATPSSDAAAPPRPDKVQEALAPPGRAGGMLPDLSSVGPAPMQADATSSRD